jgi:hypothetical protein
MTARARSHPDCKSRKNSLNRQPFFGEPSQPLRCSRHCGAHDQKSAEPVGEAQRRNLPLARAVHSHSLQVICLTHLHSITHWPLKYRSKRCLSDAQTIESASNVRTQLVRDDRVGDERLRAPKFFYRLILQFKSSQSVIFQECITENGFSARRCSCYV